jgi:anhydro-N-acetylmuramic acid kinase
MMIYKTLGVMSGTSLDGIDLAYVEFSNKHETWEFQLGAFTSSPYNKYWRKRLQSLTRATALEYAKTHTNYGHYIGKLLSDFIDDHQLKADVIGSHGHTIFHQPESGFTSQIGDGSAIAVETACPVVCDFRSMDVAREGQGAPLVPIGDALLFGQYKARVNLGGFSNISIGDISNLNAFDICPVNIVLNALASDLGKPYDTDGEIARGGQINSTLLFKLNQLEYYQKSGPKSLGVEWVEQEIQALLSCSLENADLMRTFVEHIAIQISRTLNDTCVNTDQVLFTGGGVFNSFLMERIKDLTNAQIVIPSPDIIDMKEAIIFAFLGLLRFLEQENILASYSGAKANSISGAVYLG